MKHPAGSHVFATFAEQAGLDTASLAILKNLSLARMLEATGSPDANGVAQQLLAQQLLSQIAEANTGAADAGWVETITPAVSPVKADRFFAAFSEPTTYFDPGHDVIDAAFLEWRGELSRFTANSLTDDPASRSQLVRQDRAASFDTTAAQTVALQLGSEHQARAEGPATFTGIDDGFAYLLLDEFELRGTSCTAVGIRMRGIGSGFRTRGCRRELVMAR
ncbi:MULTISPECIES: hypothetical protein [Leifsonia]|uniref:Uncharacterized protein n=1 Tax=Leifsonia shinshuensis TaxID=150026 RepID=A0A853CZ21_9MICO|nr:MULTISPECIES: hypothetical protein [Leifsonia]MBO1740711.1 hypothetical protein [Leifsonia sp. TF02-11]NYJ25837.1 hypothetical protein [Leifsonia shinshuensis]